MSKRAITILAVLLLTSGAVACEMEDTGSDGGVDTGLGSQDASEDVSLGACKVDFGIVTCRLTITNSSDGRSDYFIEGTLENSSGDKIGTANTLVTGVEGGQTAHDKLTGTVSGGGKGVDVRLTTVQRTSS